MRAHKHYLSPTSLLIGVLAVASLGCGRDSTAPLVPKTGAIEITVTTVSTIGAVDTTGYLVSIDSEGSQAVGASARVRIDGLNRSSHRITLSGLPANCYTTSDNPLSVDINPDLGTLLVTFSVACSLNGPGPWDY